MTAAARQFGETVEQKAVRLLLGTAWALKPPRLKALPALSKIWIKELVAPRRGLPDPSSGGSHGICGIAKDLSAESLEAAHRRGLYPFAHVGSPKWLCPAERCILSFSDFHISRRLRSRLRQARYHVTFDRDFIGVVRACAEPRHGKWALTWITPKIMRAYAELHDSGLAHSFEVWNASGELVAGGYGVAVGGAFTLESQFTREAHCSKIGFAVLNWHLAHWGFILNDNKLPTQNTLECGFKIVPRAEFLQLMETAFLLPDRRGTWAVECDQHTVAEWEPARSGIKQPTRALTVDALDLSWESRKPADTRPTMAALYRSFGTCEAVRPLGRQPWPGGTFRVSAVHQGPALEQVPRLGASTRPSTPDPWSPSGSLHPPLPRNPMEPNAFLRVVVMA